MTIPELIAKKRRGAELTEGEVCWFVEAVVDGSVPDYQVSALLMAICYERLSFNETLYLTRAFVDSGETLTWEGFDKPVVDKHSTGGVGDSVSLVLLPWLAAEGFIVPKMSGRGLGHTGGTIDKLESIPGFRTDLTPEEMRRVLEQVGCCVVQQSANLVPADKRLYALRDATGTVDEMGLIAASIVSKKIAAGADYIVLDVKCGNGAFFKTEDRAREFASLAIRLGREFERKIGCVISDMNQPLGRHIGNLLEFHDVDLAFVHPYVDQETTTGPTPRLYAVALTLRNLLYVLTGECKTVNEANSVSVADNLRHHFDRWIVAQGGNPVAAQSDYPPHRENLVQVDSPCSGYLQACDTQAVGEFVRSLGAGRYRIEDAINPHVGVSLEFSVGDRIEEGALFGWVVADHSDNRLDVELRSFLLSCFSIGPEPCEPIDPVIDVIL